MSMSMEDTGSAGGYVQQGFGEKEPRWDEKISWYQFPDDAEPHDYRFVAVPFYFATHWIVTKKKDGTAGKPFSVVCKNYDSKSNLTAENGCKVCDYLAIVSRELKAVKFKDWPDHIKRLGRRTTLATNAIVRDLQKQGPPQNNSGGWTFIAPLKVPQGLAGTIAEKADQFNKVKDEANGDTKPETKGFNHKNFGKDLFITYNSAAKEKTKMYQLDLGERTVLTADELAHSAHLVDFAAFLKYPSDENIEKALQQFGYYDYIETLTASSNIKQIQRSQPETEGGLATATGGESKPAARVAAAVDTAPKFNQNEELPDFEEAKPEPVTPVAASPKVEAPVVTTPPAPAVAVAVAAAPVKEVTPTVTPQTGSGDIFSKIAAFSQATGIKLAVNSGEFSDMRFFQKGMEVPECFTKYSNTEKKLCKQCPIRLDCMMADSP